MIFLPAERSVPLKIQTYVAMTNKKQNDKLLDSFGQVFKPKLVP